MPVLTITSRSAIRRAHQKPPQWGPLSKVQTNAYWAAEHVLGIDQQSIVGLWPFWEGGGSVAYDVFGHNATITNPLWVVDGLYTSDTPSYASASVDITSWNEFFVFCYVDPLETSSLYPRLFSIYYSVSDDLRLYSPADASNTISFAIDDGSPVTVTATLGSGNKSIAAGFDGNNIRLIVEGNQVSAADTPSFSGFAQDLRWGSSAAYSTDNYNAYIKVGFICKLFPNDDAIDQLQCNPYALIRRYPRPWVFDLGAGTAFTGTITATTQLPAITAAGTTTKPEYSGTAQTVTRLPVASATGTVTKPEYSGVAAVKSLLPTASASGTVTKPEFSGVGTVATQLPQAAATGTIAKPEYSGTAQAATQLPAATASGTFVKPEVTGAAVVNTLLPVINATGVLGVPSYSGTIQVNTQLSKAVASGAFVKPEVTGTASAATQLPATSAAGTVTKPEYSGVGQVSTLLPTSSAAGTVTKPEFVGTAQVATLLPKATAVGTITVPEFVGTAAVTTLLPTVDAVGRLGGEIVGVAVVDTLLPAISAKGVWRTEIVPLIGGQITVEEGSAGTITLAYDREISYS